jgi:hypothetical protein
LLKPGGLFLIETMISHPDLIVAASYRIAILRKRGKPGVA